MENKLKWRFAPTGGGPLDGIANPMIEHFTGDINYHLAREIIQNSIDARLDKDKPVKIKFKLKESQRSNFPGIDGFEKVFNLCQTFWSDDEKTIEFIQKGLNCISGATIPVLKISDYNTKGLNGGDNDRKGAWFNLVKSRGASSKTSGEGGSFGIGKGAPFAASDLRTVFYSTFSAIEEKHKFIGITELVSFEKNGEKKRGSGSYSLNGQETIQNPEDFPGKEWIREEPGLDIYIMGYKLQTNWREVLTQSVLRNFWYAIDLNELVVEIGNEIIDRESLERLMSKHFLDQPPKDFTEPKGNPVFFYQAVKNSTPIEKSLPNLGEVKFFFLPIDKHLNRVALLRKSHMVISTRDFRFPNPYVGVFICDDKKGNEELRLMEPPAHDSWIPQRNESKGEIIHQELTSFIRGVLKEQIKIKKQGYLNIPGLSRYLPFNENDITESSENGETDYSGEEGKDETSKVIQEKGVFDPMTIIDPFSVKVINSQERNAGEGKRKRTRGSKKTAGKNGAGNKKGKKSSMIIREVNIRTFIVKEGKNQMTYKVLIKSKYDKLVNIYIEAAGEEGDEKITLLQVWDSSKNPVNFYGNQIMDFHLREGKTHELEIKFDSRFKFALNFTVYAAN